MPVAVKALFFDVFGTVIAARTSIGREGAMDPGAAGPCARPAAICRYAAAEAFAPAPSECRMVAAHRRDLKSVATLGAPVSRDMQARMS
jgi:hypothetical protein